MHIDSFWCISDASIVEFRWVGSWKRGESGSSSQSGTCRPCVRRSLTAGCETSSRLSTSGRYGIDMGASPCACVCGPPGKRRLVDSTTSKLAASDVPIGESFHTPISTLYYTPPEARSLASSDATIDPLQSQLAAASPGQMGAGSSQVAFTRGHRQRAFRHALLVER